MEQLETKTRIASSIEGFVCGLRLADPEAGFGTSETFDSAFWTLFSLIEGTAAQTSTTESLRNRLQMILASRLCDDTRVALESFSDTGDSLSGSSSDGPEALPRLLGVALCETDAQRRRHRTAEVVAISHLSPLAIQSAIGLSELHAGLLEGVSNEEAVRLALEVTDHPEVRSALAVDPYASPAEIDSSRSAVAAVQCVAWVAQQNGHPFDVLRDVVDKIGGSCVAAALSGAVLGARSGAVWEWPCEDLRAEDIAGAVLDCRAQSLA